MEILTDVRWAEAIFAERPIPARTGHAVAVISNTLFLYGGADSSVGIYDDFYSLHLKDRTFRWKKIGPGPGPRKSHSLVAFQDRLLAYGGRAYSSHSQFFHCYRQGQWSELVAGPGLQNHAAVVHQDKMLLVGGLTQLNEYSSSIHQYSIKEQAWSLMATKGKGMTGRANCSIALSDKQPALFVFGGVGDSGVLSDIFKLDLLGGTWSEVKAQGGPSARRGAVMACFQGELFIFGGIQDVTRQRNDMFLLTKEQKWLNIGNQANNTYDASPTLRARQRQEAGRQLGSNRKVNGYMVQTPLRNVSGYLQDKTKSKSSSERQLSVQAKMKQIREESRRKLAAATKAQLLSRFGAEEQRQVQATPRRLSPASEAVVQTLTMLGQPERRKLNELIQSIKEEGRTSRVRENRFLEGKRPSARDGHSCVRWGKFMLIFGGDRHMMPLNDLFFFDMEAGSASSAEYSL